MEIEDLKAAWQEMSNEIAAQRKLNEKLVLDSIKRNSRDVTEDMRNGLALSLLASCIAVLLPLVWALRTTDRTVAAGALVILALALVNISVSWRVYRALGKEQNGTKSVREAAEDKLRRIHSFFRWTRSYGLLISVLAYVTGVTTYLTFRYGYVRATRIDLIVYVSLAVFFSVLTVLFTRRQEAFVAGALERCLQELGGTEARAASPSRSPDLLGPLFAACVIALSLAIVLLTWNQAAR